MRPGDRVIIIVPGGSPAMEFGARELERELRARGFGVSVQASGPLPASGHAIVLGTLQEASLASGADLTALPDKPESYALRTRRENDRLVVAGIGRDATGAMYAALELAETVLLAGTLEGIAPRDVSPFLAFRGIKLNIPFEGGFSHPTPEEDASGRRWFFDLGFWSRFTDMMARNRYNGLTLWCGHPFHHMVRVDKYPEATELSHEQLEANIDFFRRVFDLASSRGVAVYLITWNIHVPKAFAQAHGVGREGDESEVVKDYTKECVKALVTTYPKLAGIGTCAGERMRSPGDHPPGQGWNWNEEHLKWNETWVSETYAAAVKELAQRTPFIHRSWLTRPYLLQSAFINRYPGPVYVELKFNLEQMYSLPRPHFFDPAWLGPHPHGYKLLWHLRNDAIHVFRWGDPAFVRETLNSCGRTGAAGYFWGGEEGHFGTESIWTGIVGTTQDGHAFHTEQTRGHVNWDYEFEKFWFMYQLWGRLGYDPHLPDTLWEDHFAQRHGTAVGQSLYRATVTASKILPTVTAFHWNAMNGDWDPEICDGPWNTGLQFRLTRGVPGFGTVFHTVLEFIFNHTQEESWMNIPDYVNTTVEGRPFPPGSTTPVQVADLLAQCAAATMDRITGLPKEESESDCTMADLTALSTLGHYYADKIRGAIALMFFLRTGQRVYHQEAVRRLEAAADWWGQLAVGTGSHYVHPTHNWQNHLAAAKHDVLLARATIPPSPETY